MDSGLDLFQLKYQASLFSFDTSKWHLLAIVDLLRSAKFKVGKKSVHREFLIFDRNFAKIKIKGGKKNREIAKNWIRCKFGQKNFENDFWSRSEIATDETRFRGHLLFKDHTTRTARAFLVVRGLGLCCTAYAKSLAFSARWVRSQYSPQTKQ